ncbi:MAG TPA: hypothetical protein VF343_01685, partial [Syntrophales bacterium]
MEKRRIARPNGTPDELSSNIPKKDTPTLLYAGRCNNQSTILYSYTFIKIFNHGKAPATSLPR